MKNISMADLEPKSVWRYFAEICSIPHPSGREAALAKRILELAAGRGLKSRIDSAGNVRIDRPAAAGCGERRKILLQAHMDMVPQAAPGLNFDFTTMPIKPIVRGGWIVTDGTTLGADDAIGLAMALDILFDKSLKTGPLAGIFTVSEETGLVGAQAIDPAFLDGDYLINLDGGDETHFCIGCAGGCRLELNFSPETVPAADDHGLEIKLSGLRGGHSGMDIDKQRGNALIYLCRFLASEPGLRIASIEGGSVENAIPREAAALTACDEAPESVQERADRFRAALAREFEAPVEFRITAAPAALPAATWRREFQEKLLGAVTAAPDGVMARSKEFNCVSTSCNLAAMHSGKGTLVIRTSQRSMIDAERAALTDKISAHFSAIGGAPKPGTVYPGWKPRTDSALLRKAVELKEKLSGERPHFNVSHGGLEAAIFCALNPKLEIISFSPNALDLHSPAERLEIASVGRTHRFLRSLVEQG
ncbi:MAG: beta-Ala-His dipeptidase [Kiritimatiellia bacterium]